jgi:two-component system response regulator AtoC
MEIKDLKVFMVEDNELFAHMISEALASQYGYKVEVFYTGEDMLKRINEKPDVVLLDFQLDSSDQNCMNGDKVLEQIMKVQPQTKVVIISSQDDLEQAIELLKYGACDYICKDLQSVNNIAITLQRLIELMNLRSEVDFYKSKSNKEQKRLMLMVGVLLIGLILAYFLG